MAERAEPADRRWEPGGQDGAGGATAGADTPSPEPRWHLGDIFPSTGDWQAALEAVAGGLGTFDAFRGRLGDPAACAGCLSAYQDAAGALHRVATYALLERDLDLRAAEPRTHFARAEQCDADFGKATAFLRPELLALPADRWAGLVAAPELAGFRRFLDEVGRSRPHVLGAPEESLLAELSPALGGTAEVFGAFQAADLALPELASPAGPVRLTLGNYRAILQRPDRDLRRRAFLALHEAFARQRHTLAAALGGTIRTSVCLARARRYPSSLAAALEPDEIPTEVYDRLVAAVRAGVPALQGYLDLRRRALGLDELHLYDLELPLTEVETAVTYPQAVELVTAALAPLGEEYGAALVHGLDGGRWIDLPETPGKRPGAYSCGVYGVHPFVLMNFSGTLPDAFTLAHELGHALHSHFSRRQSFLSYECSLFVAEVASTVNEVLLARHLMDGPDRTLAAWAAERLLDTFRATVFRQTHFAEFEREAHAAVEAGQALSPDWCEQRHLALVRDYYAPAVAVDGEVAAEWSRIPHFHRPFYVYQYATGLSAALAVAEMIRTEGAPARDRYLAFLASGGSASPVELLRRLGVDVTDGGPVERAVAAFERDTARLAEALGMG